MSNSQYMRDIINLLENSGDQAIDMTFAEVEKKLIDATVDVAEEWEFKSSDEHTDRPAGPDTGKFIAPSYNMIKPVRNITVHSDGFPRKYVVLLKIGSGIDLSTRRQIVNDFEEVVDVYAGIDTTNGSKFVTSDGVRLFYGKVSGTAWGGAGFYIA